MRRPRVFMAAVVALCAAAASARAQQPDSVTGACARPDSVAFAGNVRISESALRGDAGIEPHTAVNYRDIQRAVKQLFATGQFSDIHVDCVAQPGHTTLIFTVAERPILSDVRVTGVEKLSANAVEDRVDLLIGRPIDPAQVTRSVARIDSLYAAAGYTLARVTVDTVTSGPTTSVIFKVSEGRRLAISGISVDGNTHVSDDDVVGGMSTQPEGFWWWRKGEFDQDAFAADLAKNIPDLYASKGFIDARVTHDTMVVDQAKGKAALDIKVAEGKQYHIGSFDVDGARHFTTADIARFYPFGDQSKSLTETVKGIFHGGGDNSVFDEAAWDAATAHLLDAYYNEGYIYARVNPVVDRHLVGPDSVPTVDLRWEIDEGQPAIIQRIDIVGNDVTDESCIRDQLLILPGSVFSRDKVQQSVQNISNLGFFETPLPPPETNPANDKGDVNLVLHVKEKHTGQVGFGASVGQGTGLGGFIQFNEPNLFGECKNVGVQWQFGQYINDFTLTYADPRIKQSQVSGQVTAYHQASRFIIRDIGQSITTGGQVRFGFPVRGSRLTRLYLDYGGESVKYGSQGLVGSINCVNCFRSTVGATLDHEGRAGIPFPFAGTHESIEADFNGGPLGGTATFSRYVAEMESYATLAQLGGSKPGSSPVLITLGIKAHAGALFGDPGPFFVSQAFSLGGVQYGIPLRGYPEFSITPLGFIPDASEFQATRQSFGNAYYTNTVELGARINSQLNFDAFYDAGNLWNRPRDFDPTRLFRGAGVGVSLVTPLGPLGVDLGYGFDQVDVLGHPAPKWQVHFKFGQMLY